MLLISWRGWSRAYDNVTVKYGYLPKEEYVYVFSRAVLVILTHDWDFEGALSGVFCDAISMGVACHCSEYGAV